MNRSIPRFVAGVWLVGALMLAGSAARAARPDYEGALEKYRAGDFAGVVATLEEALRPPPGDPDSSLLLGLAFLRLDRPDKASGAWADFVAQSNRESLVAEVARHRTLVVREGNRRAAQAAVAAEKDDPPRGVAGIVAVLPLRNRGDAQYGPLASALSAMLSANLAGLPTEDVVGRDRVERFVAAAGGAPIDDTERVARVGRLMRAAHVVVGEFVVSPSDPATVELDASLIDSASGQRIESSSFRGPMDRFYAPVRDTAVALSSELGWPVSVLPQVPAARVTAIHTKSLPAALAFGRGLEREGQGDFFGARGEYEAALREDPSFALVQRQLRILPETEMSLGAIADAVEARMLAEPAVTVPGGGPTT